MDKTNLNDLQRLRALLNEKKYTELQQNLSQMNDYDIALIMESMEDEDMLKMFRILGKDKAADVFSLLETDSQQYIITSLSDKEAGIVIDNLQSDDAADLLEEMPASIVKKLLENARPDTRKDINHLLQYPEDSAGSVMTVEFVDLKTDMTVEQAIERIKSISMDSETINICYVLDAKRKLMGTCALRYLLLNNNDVLIGDIMHENVISCDTAMDQEDAAKLFQKYDLAALPVVDHENRMVGIITIDDIMDVMQKETTEDIEKMAAIIPTDKAYLKTTVFETWKKRFPWLMLLMLSATFTGAIISNYENALSRFVVLTSYIPMLMDTGGNAGSQASTEVVRALSLGQISFKDFFKVIFKEMRVGILCGITLSAAAFLKCIFIDQDTWIVASVVCITIICAVFLSKLCGSMLTMAVYKLGFDPAVVASPLLTTVIDALSLLIYFNVASIVLQI